MRAATSGMVPILVAGGLMLLIAMPVWLLAQVFLAIRTRRWQGMLAAGFCVAGTLGGGMLAWNLVPSDWTASFPTTLAASVDAQRYGHTMEHAAENIVAMVLFASVVCGVLSGLAAALGTRLAARLKHRPTGTTAV